jgi:drug/metabolite transporter (DMT)-like permease
MLSTADKIYFGLQLVGQLLIALWIVLYHFKREQASRIVAVLTVVCIAATFIAFWFTTWAIKMSGLGLR